MVYPSYKLKSATAQKNYVRVTFSRWSVNTNVNGKKLLPSPKEFTVKSTPKYARTSTWCEESMVYAIPIRYPIRILRS